jgi:hypothetical protein
MAKNDSGGVELGLIPPVTGSFTATGNGAEFKPRPGKFNLAIYGTFTATVKLQRSFDGGDNWIDCTNLGSAVSFSTAATEVIDEPEREVRYRLNCSAYTSGTVNWRLSQ